jgi:LmbE family N-acetylglucosaminyl deacetylase
MIILAIGAHPDDLEIYCYGTLAKFVKNGHTVYTSTTANGNKGHYEIKPDKLAEIRCNETTKAAAVIGAGYIGLGIDDLEVDSHNKSQQKKMVELIRGIKPDMIITHGPEDYMSDHVETSRLVFYASFGSSIPHYITESPFHDSVAPVYYMENSCGIDFIPQDYVDISDVMDLKIKAIQCHESQMKWLGDHDGFNMLHFSQIMAEFRGAQCGAKYAESFAQCRIWPRLLSKRILP